MSTFSKIGRLIVEAAMQDNDSVYSVYFTVEGVTLNAGDASEYMTYSKGEGWIDDNDEADYTLSKSLEKGGADIITKDGTKYPVVGLEVIKSSVAVEGNDAVLEADVNGMINVPKDVVESEGKVTPLITSASIVFKSKEFVNPDKKIS